MCNYPNMDTLAERLTSARKEKDWTKAQLMRAAKLKSPSTLTDLESGKALHSPQIVNIAIALGVNPVWLQTGKGSKAQSDVPAEADPVIDALEYLDRTMPARAKLFRAQIIAAQQEAMHLELEREAIVEHQAEAARLRQKKQDANQA